MTSLLCSATPASEFLDAPPPSASAVTAGESDIPTLTDQELLMVNLDIETLVARIFLRAPELRQVEAAIQASWQDPGPHGRVERLEQYARELKEAHYLCVGLQARLPSPSSLAEELAKVRQRLLNAANALAIAMVVRAKAFEPYRQVRSHRALARSVCGIVSVYLAHWELIRERTPVPMAELERALRLAQEFAVVIQGKHRGCDALGPALRQRQQLFTLLLREYAALRRAARFLYDKPKADRLVPSLYGKSPGRVARAVTYLRGDQGDADQIAPSFYSLRNARRRGSEEAPLVPESAATPEGAESTAAPSAPAAPADKAPTPPPGPTRHQQPRRLPHCRGPVQQLSWAACCGA